MSSSLRVTEIGAWCLGIVCASTLSYHWVEAHRMEVAAAGIHSTRPELQAHGRLVRSTWSLPTPPAPIPPSPTSKMRPLNNSDELLGRLDIPALKLTTPIVESTDDHSLMVGAGHVQGTALPGGLGNFVIAAHRDTYFRPLGSVHAGMRMEVVTSNATYTYVVDSTEIVAPEDVDVLDMGDVPQMTLITCYPFHYIGSAPKRFIVRAHLLDY